MLRYASLFTVAAVSLLFVGRACAADGPSLTIAMQFEHRYSRASVDEMKREFDRIMLPGKLRIVWRMLADLDGSEPFHDIVVARFEGDCEADPATKAPPTSPRLGLTHLIDGDVSPFADLDCGKIRGMLAQAGASETVFEWRRLLGRAMARVLAHEVYHAVLQTTEHSSRGIAKASLSPAELFSASLRFEPEEMARIGLALTAGADAHNRSTVTLSILPVNVKGTL